MVRIVKSGVFHASHVGEREYTKGEEYGDEVVDDRFMAQSPIC